jgi:drug/metabolite transporter (DMT)-like permease
MSPTRRPQVEVEIIEDDDSIDESPPGWTPLKGLTRGAAATACVGALLAWALSVVAIRRPDLAVFYKHDDAQVTFVLILLGALVGFILSWILFATMHRVSQMVGWSSTLVVIGILLAIVVVKQMVFASHGGKIPEVATQGWAWLQPAAFLKSNIGMWMGMFVGVWLMRDGDSPLDAVR